MFRSVKFSDTVNDGACVLCPPLSCGEASWLHHSSARRRGTREGGHAAHEHPAGSSESALLDRQSEPSTCDAHCFIRQNANLYILLPSYLFLHCIYFFMYAIIVDQVIHPLCISFLQILGFRKNETNYSANLGSSHFVDILP